VIEKIRAYVDAGCTTPILRFASWDQKGQLTRALEKVLGGLRAPPKPPNVRSAPAKPGRSSTLR
jgi:hypothetical protein